MALQVRDNDDTSRASMPQASTPSECAQPNRDEFLGAIYRDKLTRFRVWAPQATTLEVHIESPQTFRLPLEPAADGYFVGESSDVPLGSRYKYSLDGQEPWPDPCSRFQPEGPHGPSAIVDADSYRWNDANWRGATLERQVMYELHVGTFTPEGTFDAAAQRLEHLRDVGITMIELLPVCECPGRWNWGYDGVQLYAPFHVYGKPDALKRFIERAHALGIAVILDVVYNHLGPDGNYLKCYSSDYFSRRYKTEWGEALNFDATNCLGARDFVINNAKYWIREFHFDGFRLDATQSIFDSSHPHVIAQLIAECRASTDRALLFVAENEPQRGEHLWPQARGGFGLDAMWNDDFHHSMRVALTGSRDGYYCDYTGRAQELLSAIKYGFLFQGQYYSWQKKPRGSPLRGSARNACVHFLQNHDQVGNTGVGDRVHAYVSARRYRAATAVLLLGPQTPLLFMGQEFLASNRFMFFADHRPELDRLVHKGRREFVGQFQAYATEAVQASIRDPGDERTFNESKLDWNEVERHGAAMALHRDLLRLRREDALFSNPQDISLDGATLSESAFVLRWFAPDECDRLLVVNFDHELRLGSIAEPLLAPPLNKAWSLVWASEDPRYGGLGVIDPLSNDGRWRIPAECAVLLQAID